MATKVPKTGIRQGQPVGEDLRCARPRAARNATAAAVGESVDKLDITIIRQASGLDDRQLSQLPGVLVGSPHEIAERLQRYREEYGTSYISVLEPHMAAFAKVIKHLR